MNDSLFNQLKKNFPIPQGTKKEPYLILFDAYTGMGKSTVSKVIAQKDNSLIINNDEIRSFINDYQDKTNIKSLFQKYRLEEALKNHNSCILDSCFCHNYHQKLSYYQSLGYKYYIIRLECSSSTIKKRLASRHQNEPTSTTYQDYLWMVNNVPRVPDELITFTINTEQDLEPQIGTFLTKFNLKEDI